MKGGTRKPDARVDLAQLTDAEADFVLQRWCWLLRDATNPFEFFREHGRGITFEVAEGDREQARGFVRMLARGESGTVS